MKRSAVQHEGQRGFALVVVILVLLMVSFLAVELTLSVRSETISGFNARQQVVGRALAQGALNMGIFSLIDTPQEDGEEPYLQGERRDVWLADGLACYQVVSEAGKIDINYVDKPLLGLLLSYYGLEEEEIDIIADSLLDWQDSDDLHRLNGAESDYYEGLDDPYQPRNGKIRDPQEFFLVRGTEKLAGRLTASEIFTVHNRQNRVDFNQLTPAMLDFLTNGDAEAKALYGRLRRELGTLDVENAQLVLGDERFAEIAPYLSFSPAHNTFFTIMASGYAGVRPPEEEEAEATPRPAGSHIAVLLEKRGKKIRYLGWREQMS